jgi:CubicO group peptidase (beta-lactamase class C family)
MIGGPRQNLGRRRMRTDNVTKLDALLEPLLRTGRIPGAAIAIVADDRLIYARGFGYRDLRARRPLRPDTVYPIASTTKAINATLLGMLVDEGSLEWDVPIQRYLPTFKLADAAISARVTIRDLVTMRTGLPRHDWVWWGYPMTRGELTARLAHLPLSADFRERFQYSNLSVTAAGHVAEVISGESWETMARRRIFRPLGMKQTSCKRPRRGNVTQSYHESGRRKLIRSQQPATEVTAPSGGAVHSTVLDMTRWIMFNLGGGVVNGRRLIKARTLAQLHRPQVAIGEHASTQMPPDATYGLGWLIDSYGGHRRLSHGGYLHDVNSSVMLFPDLAIGAVCFVNLGCSRLASLLNECAVDALAGTKSVHSVARRLADYEREIAATRRRVHAIPRIGKAPPARPLRAYCGIYEHTGYGVIEIRRRDRKLYLERRDWRLTLHHWHYEIWVAEDSDIWPIHESHAFDATCPLQFSAAADGSIAGLFVRLEPLIPPIWFAKSP